LSSWSPTPNRFVSFFLLLFSHVCLLIPLCRS
jgi:hypothetical protein